ncbi:MAG: MBL fold metallo-hydrolase [Clostridia bacterium]|nr:MBL fold metallo-hydrolase [Clostridia bacterium]
MTEEKTVMPYEEISKGVYLINEYDGVNCYLVLGSEKALLIDCGTGTGDFKATVGKITDLPLSVLATHGHVDHIGGADQFPFVYVYRDDCKTLNRLQTSLLLRKLFVCANGAMKARGVGAKDVKKGAYKPKLVPIDESFTLDLGSKTITVKHTKGHTVGSIAVIDEEDGIIFSGDNVCDALWMHMPGAASLEEWLPGAQWLYEKSLKYKIYWGHRTPRLESDYILQVINWGKEILASHGKNSFLAKTKQYPAREDGIIYKTNKVYKKGN